MDQLNDKMMVHFKQFRSHPVKIKHFTEEEKTLTRQVLDQFENSSDEELVKLEGIQLGDGNYERISNFSSNVHKLHKLLKAKTTIEKIKDKHYSDNIRSGNQRGSGRRQREKV